MKFLIAFIFALLQISLGMACPNCKDALSTEGSIALARGYYWSIMVMLSLPFILVGTVAFLIVRAQRVKEMNNQGTGKLASTS